MAASKCLTRAVNLKNILRASKCIAVLDRLLQRHYPGACEGTGRLQPSKSPSRGSYVGAADKFKGARESSF